MDTKKNSNKKKRVSDHIAYQILTVSQRMGAVLSKQYADEFGISIAEWRTMTMLNDLGEGTAAQIVSITPMDKVAVSRAAASLVERGYIERKQREDDRRSAMMRLSPEGQKICDAINKRAFQRDKLMMSSFTKEETAEFFRLLEKLNMAIDELDKD